MKRPQSMANDTKSERVPKLRFPEFRNDAGWDAKPGNELFDQISNREALAGLPILAITQEQGAIPRDEIDYHVSVTDKSVETYKEVRPGDFIISLRSFQGGIEYSNHHGICSPAYVILRKKANLADTFFKHLFKSHSFIQQLNKNLEGLRDGKMISYKQFSQLVLPLPIPAEQQKIAECLSTLEALIGIETHKLGALKTHKRGLMQQLFPREGEIMPRLRFPEFQREPEWSEKGLADVSPSIFDGTHQTPTYISEGVPFYSVENVISGSANKFISRDDYVLATRNNKPEKEDILLTRIGKIGYSQVVGWDHDFSVYVTLAVIKRSPLFNSHYLHYFAQSERYQSELLGKSLPNAVPPKINLDALRSTKVLLPQAEEQQRIASCLSSLDELIAAQSGKLEGLMTHKKGLTQQLFPSPVETEA